MAAAQTRTGSASWLILAYRVPAEPARLRAGVWRRLKAAGAVYLANSVAALPASPAAERVLRRLRNEIGRSGGSAQLLRAQALAGELDVIRLFNAARNEEYVQIVAACDDLLGEIRSWAASGRCTFVELEHGERELARLAAWHEKVRLADAFGASQAEAATTVLASCRDALEEFAAHVYAAVDESRSD